MYDSWLGKTVSGATKFVAKTARRAVWVKLIWDTASGAVKLFMDYAYYGKISFNQMIDQMEKSFAAAVIEVGLEFFLWGLTDALVTAAFTMIGSIFSPVGSMIGAIIAIPAGFAAGWEVTKAFENYKITDNKSADDFVKAFVPHCIDKIKQIFSLMMQRYHKLKEGAYEDELKAIEKYPASDRDSERTQARIAELKSKIDQEKKALQQEITPIETVDDVALGDDAPLAGLRKSVENVSGTANKLWEDAKTVRDTAVNTWNQDQTVPDVRQPASSIPSIQESTASSRDTGPNNTITSTSVIGGSSTTTEDTRTPSVRHDGTIQSINMSNAVPN
jgi:hypothetical protein